MAQSEAKRRPSLPEFNPARWAGQATRAVDLGASIDALVAVLSSSSHTDDATLDNEEARRARVRACAAALRETAPLFALTAALIAPWLVEVTGETVTGKRGDSAADTAAISDRLTQFTRYLFEESGLLEIDPWSGLVEWVWSHQNALAIADLNRDLGGAAVRALPPLEYRRKLQTYLGGTIEALRERSGHLVITYAQELAKAAVLVLEPGALTSARLARLLGTSPLGHPAELLPANRTGQVISDILAPFEDGHLTVMSSAHFQALREALYKGSFNHDDDTPWPTAQLTRGGILGQAQLRPPGTDGETILREEELDELARLMWRQREELSDLDADALDALSAIWLAQAQGVGDRAVADVDGLLTMRGIKPRSRGNGRRSGFEPEQRAEMQRAIAHIQNIWINIAQVPDPAEEWTAGEVGNDRHLTLQSRAFVITDRLGRTDKTGTMIDMERFIFQPGAVFARYLLGPGSQTALLSAQALKYDPYRQTWEKRLARFLSWHWRASTPGRHTRPYRVTELLDAIGKEINTRYPNSTRERLEKTLDTLETDGVISRWQYERWDEAISEQRGWAQRWLTCILLIDPPAIALEYLRQERPALPRRTMPNEGVEIPNDPGELGALIKTARLDRGLNQTDVARLLGVKQSYISKLERNANPQLRPSAAFRKGVRDWLAEG
ncbi:MAG TPA: helix-turn-helix transcriptional regulator [Thermomicrobiales bacterium]|jgi:DNA-binding XRE family transcriptional regulator